MHMSPFHLFFSNVRLFKLCWHWCIIFLITNLFLHLHCVFLWFFSSSFSNFFFILVHHFHLRFHHFFRFLQSMKSSQCSSFLNQENSKSCESSVYTSSWCVPKCNCGDKVMIRRTTTDKNFWGCPKFKVNPNFSLIYVQMW